MANRLDEKFRSLRDQRKKAFSVFLTAGFPNMSVTEKMIHACWKEGVDSIELGFPFSDPLADGPTVQFSSQVAIDKGVRMEDVFKMVQRVRRKGNNIPIVFFTYLNPITRFGVKRFASAAKKAGFDAVLVPDLPPEEEGEFQERCAKANLHQVFLIAPTTKKNRTRMIARKSRGFIYYVSLRGVTGARKSLPADLEKHLKEIRSVTTKPVLVGFGVSEPAQAKRVCRSSDGVIVGSALVNQIHKAKGNVNKVLPYIRKMVKAVKGYR